MTDDYGKAAFVLVLRPLHSADLAARPNNFDQNFDEDVFHAPLVAGGLAVPAGDVPEPFIDIEDVADVAAEVLTNPGKHAGQIFELTGPRAVTFGEAVELISRASGQPITFKQISAAEYTAALVEEGVSPDDAQHVAEMFVMMERGLMTDGVATVLGREPRSFEDYVLRTAAAGAWQR